MYDGASVRLCTLLAPWLRAWRAGLTSVDDVVSAVTGAAGAAVEQSVETVDPLAACDLTSGLSYLSSVPEVEIRLILAVPGDVRGLPTSGPFTAAAVTSGEAVRAGSFGLVPQQVARVSGSGDSWHTVTWQMFTLDEASQAAAAEAAHVGEAEATLTEALHEATKAFAALDVAPWGRQSAADSAQLGEAAGGALPPGFDRRARRLYARATMLDKAVQVAESDALGGAVTAREAAARLEALRPLAAACRQGILAACHAAIGSNRG